MAFDSRQFGEPPGAFIMSRRDAIGEQLLIRYFNFVSDLAMRAPRAQPGPLGSSRMSCHQLREEQGSEPSTRIARLRLPDNGASGGILRRLGWVGRASYPLIWPCTG